MLVTTGWARLPQLYSLLMNPVNKLHSRTKELTIVRFDLQRSFHHSRFRRQYLKLKTFLSEGFYLEFSTCEQTLGKHRMSWPEGKHVVTRILGVLNMRRRADLYFPQTSTRPEASGYKGLAWAFPMGWPHPSRESQTSRHAHKSRTTGWMSYCLRTDEVWDDLAKRQPPLTHLRHEL